MADILTFEILGAVPLPAVLQAFSVDEDGKLLWNRDAVAFADPQGTVRYDTEQSLTDAEKNTARQNIGAGTSNFDGNYDSLSGKPTKLSEFENDEEFLTDSSFTESQWSAINSGVTDDDVGQIDTNRLAIIQLSTDLTNGLAFKQNKAVTRTALLTAAGWSDKTQTVTVSGVAADNLVQVSPVPSDISKYGAAQIVCMSQTTDSLTFTAETVPEDDISVNVVIWG